MPLLPLAYSVDPAYANVPVVVGGSGDEVLQDGSDATYVDLSLSSGPTRFSGFKLNHPTDEQFSPPPDTLTLKVRAQRISKTPVDSIYEPSLSLSWVVDGTTHLHANLNSSWSPDYSLSGDIKEWVWVWDAATYAAEDTTNTIDSPWAKPGGAQTWEGTFWDAWVNPVYFPNASDFRVHINRPSSSLTAATVRVYEVSMFYYVAVHHLHSGIRQVDYDLDVEAKTVTFPLGPGAMANDKIYTRYAHKPRVAGQTTLHLNEEVP